MVEQAVWRVRRIQELTELNKDLDVEAHVKKKRLERIEHVIRMDQGRTVKKILESEQKESRRKQIRKFRWLEDIKKDLLEMKAKKWRQQAVDRKEGTFVIREAKALGGP